MTALARRCSSSSEACVRRCRKATSLARRRRSTQRSPRLRRDTGRRTRLRLSLRRRRRPRLQPESQSRRRKARSAAPTPTIRHCPAPQRACGARASRSPRRDRLRKPVRQANPGPQPRPFRARRSDLRRRHQERSQPAGSPQQAPTPVAGRPAAAAPTAATSPARSQLAAAMANQPSSVSRTGRAAPPVGAKDGKDEGLPGVAALDPARAVRPNKTDDGNASDAPPVVASRRDEPGQWAEAPEVAAEFDRPGLAIQTGGGDPAPGCARRRSRQAETLALDRGGGRPWNCPCGGGSRNPDASEAAGPRHQAPRRDAATRPAGALGEDRRAGASEPARSRCAASPASGPQATQSSAARRGGASDPGARDVD